MHIQRYNFVGKHFDFMTYFDRIIFFLFVAVFVLFRYNALKKGNGDGFRVYPGQKTDNESIGGIQNGTGIFERHAQ